MFPYMFHNKHALNKKIGTPLNKAFKKDRNSFEQGLKQKG